MEPEINGPIPTNQDGVINWTGVSLIITIIVIMAAMVIPNFLRSSRPPRQSEAKSNLAAIHTAQTSYMSETGTYGKTFREINWQAEGKPRYVYFLSPTEHIGRPPGELGLTLPVDFKALGVRVPGSSATGFTAVAIGNIDSDPDLDIWSINDDKLINNDLNDV